MSEIGAIKAWYNEIPICTKFLFSSFVLVTLLGNTLVSPFYLFHSPYHTFFQLQIWRLYTSFFFHPINLGAAFQLYFLYRYSKEIETTKFAGKTADYVFFLLFEALMIIMLGWFVKLYMHSQSLIMAIIYIWSKFYKDANINFFFFTIRGVYFPYALLLMEILQVPMIPWQSLIGVITGHAYYYLEELYPASGGTRFLNTPQWLYKIFPNVRTTSTPFGTILNPGRNVQQPQQAGRNWGRGYRLGQ